MLTIAHIKKEPDELVQQLKEDFIRHDTARQEKRAEKLREKLLKNISETAIKGPDSDTGPLLKS